MNNNPFSSLSEIKTASGSARMYRLDALDKAGLSSWRRLPVSLKILLENILRHCDGKLVMESTVAALARWEGKDASGQEIPFMPARVLLQDFTGVPVVADLAAMRSAMARLKRDSKKINPIIPVDLVTDHSVTVEVFGTPTALTENVRIEYGRNQERYRFLKWAQKGFQDLSIVPPGTGIVHQVNLEYLAKVVFLRGSTSLTTSPLTVFPDTVVGTDSHTTMINGLGVLGWGVGGIEAEACMLGQPMYMLIPEVVGFRLTGEVPAGATATDVVLTVTEILRKHGVVNKFVEFYGPGVANLTLADRATIANMAPEYGATMGFFPVDAETLRYMRMTGREEAQVDLVERYCKEQGLWSVPDEEPIFSAKLELNLNFVEPSLAGPRRPQDRVALSNAKESWLKAAPTFAKKGAAGASKAAVAVAQREPEVKDGSVVIAAITSCTNTSNPSVLIGAGILAKKAVERGLSVKPHVKTSLAPGSRVVTDYLNKAGLTPYLDKLGFYLVGYGCTTCIGNSGPLPEPVAKAVKERDLAVVAVLSGNRNFEGRINPLVKAAYLASPPLVVAYALAGSMEIDLVKDPIGQDKNGKPVYLKEIWPTPAEIKEAIERSIDAKLFRERYGQVFDGDEQWRKLEVKESDLYPWDSKSTYIQEPPFFKDFSLDAPAVKDIKGARMLLMVGDSITTDHISPAGSIAPESPAGKYLSEHGVSQADFNSYGARRGNHEVMMRGTFANIRLKNLMIEDTGPFTLYYPGGVRLPVYEAAMLYQKEGVPTVVVAGKEYGSGSSRDWAAKGPALLGVKAAIAESFERIHRSNLVGMGVLPLEFLPGDNAVKFQLKGDETFDIQTSGDLKPRQRLTVKARRSGGETFEFETIARLDTPIDVQYYKNGGILQAVLRAIIQKIN